MIRLLPIALAIALVSPLRSTAQSASPADVARILANSSSPRRAALVSQFNLRENDSPCSDFKSSPVETLWSGPHGAASAIELDSGTCLTKFLIVLRQSGTAWVHAGTIALDQRYNQPTWEVVQLVAGMPPMIVVHGNVTDSGTGISQKNVQIFALLDGRLGVVFNQPESIQLSVPYKPNCCPEEYVERETSSFQIVPSTADHAQAEIKETRHIEVNGTSVTQYRSFHWDDRLQNFVSVAFAPSP